MADDPASTLAGIREDNDRVIALCAIAPAAVRQLAEHDVPALLAAIEAALKEADDWEAEARGIFLEAARTSDAGEVGAASALQSAAADLRAAITAALGGKEAGDEATGA